MFIQKEIHSATIIHLLSGLNLRRFFQPVLLRASVILVLFVLVQTTSSSARAASVTLSATPTTRTINQGQSTTYTINIGRDGFTGKVTLSASNLPSGATASFTPNSTTGNSSVMTVVTATTTPVGTYSIKVSGSATGVTISSINVMLIVKPAPNVTITTNTTAQSIVAGQSTSIAIKLARTNYDGPITLTADLPNGLTASFEPPGPIYGNDATMRIYSSRNPFVTRDYDILISLKEFNKSSTVFRLRVNCDIDWADQFGSGTADFGRVVAADNNGNVYVAGETHTAQNSTDVWVAKYNNRGTLVGWADIATDREDRVKKIVVDNAGNVYVGGYTDGIFPGYPDVPNSHFDFWIAKYVSNSDGSISPAFPIVQHVIEEEDGVHGFEIVPDNAGGGKLVTFRNGRREISTFTFDSAGNLSFVSGFHVDVFFRHEPSDIAIGPNGSIYVVGRAPTNNFPNVEDSYIVKYDSVGNELWRDTIDNANEERANCIAVDSAGNAYVAGVTNYNAVNRDTVDAWIAKFGANSVSFATPLWVKTEASPKEDVINDITINSSGDIVLVGMTQGVLGAERGAGNVGNTRFDDAFVERRNSNGDLVWVKQFAVNDIDGFHAVATVGNGIYMAGYTVNFKNNNMGFEDVLVMSYVDSSRFILPSISGLSPSSARVGQIIRINGQFFGSSVTGVRINGVAATFTVVSSTAIDVVVPSGATTGLVTLSVNCNSVSSPAAFTVLP